MYKYSFKTRWVFNAPLEIIWNEIRAIHQWPDWWKYVKSVTPLHPGDLEEIGSMHKIVWTSMLPYRLSFNSELISMDYHRRIEGRAYGDLEGLGIWTFETKAGQTIVTYDWKVNTTKLWMKLLAPLAAPLFRWNHDKVMKGGYDGLKKRVQSVNG